ncbi:MAG: hypothetical protein GPJ52_00155 [Candidatus Heimdallarchaeota archaeon]|nr:hypothetical protein [Candidatus Heimdallarchaeota archaeon]
MQEIYTKMDQIMEKLESKDLIQILQGIDSINQLFRNSYPANEGHIIYTEISKVVPVLVDILMTTDNTQVMDRIRGVSEKFTTFPEMYDALVDLFHRNIEQGNTSLQAGRYLKNFHGRLLDTQNLYLEALQSKSEYMRLMALKLLSELSGRQLKSAKPKRKKTTAKSSTSKKAIKGSVSEVEISDIKGLLPPEVMLQLFLDVAATDKSPQARRNAWSLAGGQNKEENIDYLLEDILKSVLFDILIQFQPGVQVQLSRITDLIGDEPFNRLKELITDINESNVMISVEEVSETIQELIEDQQIDGTYFELEQVFVLGKMDKQQFKPKSFRKDFLCMKCANNIDLNDKVCSTCQKEVTRCMICKRPISFGEEIASCPKCQNQAHFAHLQEWIKAKGKCPMCSAKLKENDIASE